MTAPLLLTIAGSDAMGRAGIQADLKVFADHGCRGTSIVTALTLQDAGHFERLNPIPAGLLFRQMERLEHLSFAGVKIGMLATAENVRVVCDDLKKRRPPWVVLDPVFRSTTGAALLDDKGKLLLQEELLPLVDWITPNLEEAQFFISAPVTNLDQMKKAALMIWRSLWGDAGKKGVVIKGGHLAGAPIDLVFDGHEMKELAGVRIPGGPFDQAQGRPFHGTGCRFSSALLAYLVAGQKPQEAATAAKLFVAQWFRHI